MPKGVKGFQQGNEEGKKKSAKSIEQQVQRELFNELVDEKWGDIIRKHIASALLPGKAGNEPRRYIIDQRVGRATEQIIIEGDIDLHMDF